MLTLLEYKKVLISLYRKTNLLYRTHIVESNLLGLFDLFVTEIMNLSL